MLKQQENLIMSPHLELYDLLIDKDNELRQINETVDFSFVHDELKDKYCLVDGRNAIDPIRMFKYLFLKTRFKVSDKDLIDRTKTDMAFKYFLDMAPEELPIDPSLLSKFRRHRLKDMDLLNLLITKTVSIAIEKGVLKSSTIIVDSTHTSARYKQKRAVDILRDQSKEVRKKAYSVDESIKEQLPEKNAAFDLDAEKEYTQKLIDVLEASPVSDIVPVKESISLLKEKMEDLDETSFESHDQDARVGHKTADSAFLGYKSHLAMTDERLITAAVITSGEKSDGQYLEELLTKTRANGVEVKDILADTAYSGKGNLELLEKKENEDIRLISKLHPYLSKGTRKKDDIWDFNKDAGMVVCPAGHLAIKKVRHKGRKSKNENDALVYYFDIEKCKNCPMREGCYKVGQKSKSYSIRLLSDVHKKQEEFQETAEFKEKAKQRYMIEAKNAELKNRYGYDKAISSGLFGMNLQSAMTIFVVNIKRIMKLMNEKGKKK